MSADVLRRAAALMRDRAQAATPGPWDADGNEVWHLPAPATSMFVADTTFVTPEHDERRGSQPRHLADAEHIASWHPLVALAVADWLDEAADFLTAYPGETHSMDNPLAVARAYLRSDS